MVLKGYEQQRQGQRAVYKKVPVAFHLLGIRFVEMDQMGIEGESRKAKE